MRYVLFSLLLASGIMWSMYDQENALQFVSPIMNAQIKNTLTIQIIPDFQVQNQTVTISIEHKPQTNNNIIIWTGELSVRNNFIQEVDISSFPQGKYELKGTYYMGGDAFNGNVVFWITK